MCVCSPHPVRPICRPPPWRLFSSSTANYLTASVQVVDYEFKVLLSRGFDLEVVHPTEHISAFLLLTEAPFQVRACFACFACFACLLCSLCFLF